MPLLNVTSDSSPEPVTPPDEALLFRMESLESVAIDVDSARRALGIQPDRPGHQRWFTSLSELADALPPIMRPRALYRVDEVAALQRRTLTLASGATYAGAVGQFLAHSRYVATFLVTVGGAVERLSRRWLRRGRVVESTVADAIASEAAEAVARHCQDALRDWARPRGLDVTPRYSPGYCGMNLRQQTVVFASLPHERIRVTLSPSCLMTPVKSVSGLIGIGPAELVGPGGYPCQRCDHPDCAQRRVPLDQNPGRCFDWQHVDECPRP